MVIFFSNRYDFPGSIVTNSFNDFITFPPGHMAVTSNVGLETSAIDSKLSGFLNFPLIMTVLDSDE